MLVWPLVLFFLLLLTGSLPHLYEAATGAHHRAVSARQAQDVLARATLERQRLADLYGEEIECTRAVRRRALEVMRAAGATGTPSASHYQSAAEATACHPAYQPALHSPFDPTKVALPAHHRGVAPASGYDPITGRLEAGALGKVWADVHGAVPVHTLTGMDASPGPTRVAGWDSTVTPTLGPPADERHVYDWASVSTTAPRRYAGWLRGRTPKALPGVCRGGSAASAGGPLSAGDAAAATPVVDALSVAGLTARARTACTRSVQVLPHQALRTDGFHPHDNEAPAPGTVLSSGAVVLDAAVPLDGPHLAMAARAGDAVVHLAPHVDATRGHRPRGFTYPLPLPFASEFLATATTGWSRDAPGPDRVYQGVEDAFNRTRVPAGVASLDCQLPHRSPGTAARTPPARTTPAAVDAGLCPPPAHAYAWDSDLPGPVRSSPTVRSAPPGLVLAPVPLKPDAAYPTGLPGIPLFTGAGVVGAAELDLNVPFAWGGSTLLETELRTTLIAAGRVASPGVAADAFLPASMRSY